MKHNFSAGPSILPKEVFQQAANGILNFNELELSVLEISHRSKDFVEVLDRSVELVKELLQLPDTHKPLFLTGGASSQFFMAPMNLLASSGTAHYVDTGSWSTKAIKEAKLFGEVNVLASSKESNFSYIPKDYERPTEGTYLHLTSNNTIYGTQYARFPDVDMPLVCDMSSDIFSRPIDVNKFGLIYAGAQKNMGPAGTTLVVVNEELLGHAGRDIPTMLDYRTHIKKNSAFNTPPVFPIYVSMLVMEWVLENGGVAAMQKRNEEKAKLMYDEIDRNPLFKGVAEKADRSRMNATFVLKNPDLGDAFLSTCEKAGCVGVKGHRSVGGFRASMYNAMPIESVKVLVDLMREFERTHG
ncbi:MAG: 3-phosphoserine/phosphohydroxythreonine transaminase [Bacteroidetes bacterium]|jgi:phosphoserine aminotransferase|nr:3-phosphoserine/phosphohydroxythreonine transaminase [Bacteroidota bacterium]